jgi:cell division protein FtsB
VRSTSKKPAAGKHRSVSREGDARLRRTLRLGLLFFAGLVIVDALVGERGLLAMLRARQQQQELATAVARQRAENAKLREEVRRLTEDPAAIEEIARRELGLMRPGEKLFIIRDLPSHHENDEDRTARDVAAQDSPASGSAPP